MTPREQLTTAIIEWAARHPRPFAPVLCLGDRDYTPQQVLQEVEQHTSTGEFLVDVATNLLSTRSLKEILATFEGVTSNQAR